MGISWKIEVALLKIKSLQKGIKTLLEALPRHLLVTPPSHQLLQKAKG
jgi:hypothetical protein